MRLKDTVGISYILSAIEREMHVLMDAALSAFDMTLAQYWALAMLEQYGELTNAQLAKHCSVSPQTMIRITVLLEEKGSIVKVKNKGESVGKRFSVARKMLGALGKAHAAVKKIENSMLGSISKNQQSQFLLNLTLCLNGLRK